MKKISTKILPLALLLLVSTTVFSQKKLLGIYTETYGGSSYTPYDSTVYTYNSQNQVTVETRKLYDAGTWKNFSKKETTYLTSGKEDVITYYNWTNNTWVKSLQYRNQYNSSNVLITVDNFKWVNNNWEQNYADHYVYLTNSKIDSVITKAVDASKNETNYSRDKYTYTAHGELASTVTERWTTSSSTWGLSARLNYFYDSDNTLFSYEEDNYIGNQWFHIHNYAYTYDSDKLVREALHKNSATGQIISRSKYKYEGDINAGIDKIQATQAQVTLYPNPATTNAVLSWETDGDYALTVTDITGKAVYTSNVVAAKSTAINTSELVNGIYFYSLNNANGIVAKGKFMVQQ